MKWFHFFKDKKVTDFQITEADRGWVEDNFKWLIQVYGYPPRQSRQLELNEESFPSTLNAEVVEVQNILDDLSFLFCLDRDKVLFELQEDLRDSHGVPYEMVGEPFESETVIGENIYKIIITKSLTRHPKRMLCCLIREFLKIRLSEDKHDYDTGEDTDLFLYLAGVYFGFGVILSQNLVDRGISSDGLWETRWNYVAQIPGEVIAFALATYSKLIEQDRPDWKNQLPDSVRPLFEKAIDFLNNSPSPLFSREALEISTLMEQAEIDSQNKDFDAAISSLQKVMFLTNDEIYKAVVYNGVGYYQLRKGALEESMLNFRKALETNANFGFAYDNLGYALLRTGCFEDGKLYLDLAIETGNNNKAYSYRNLAFYYEKIGEMDLAEKNYRLAFEYAEGPVDLLEYHYGEFLIAQGRLEEGNEYLQRAVEKGESEAIK